MLLARLGVAVAAAFVGAILRAAAFDRLGVALLADGFLVAMVALTSLGGLNAGLYLSRPIFHTRHKKLLDTVDRLPKKVLEVSIAEPVNLESFGARVRPTDETNGSWPHTGEFGDDAHDLLVGATVDRRCGHGELGQLSEPSDQLGPPSTGLHPYVHPTHDQVGRTATVTRSPDSAVAAVVRVSDMTRSRWSWNADNTSSGPVIVSSMRSLMSRSASRRACWI